MEEVGKGCGGGGAGGVESCGEGRVGVWRGRTIGV